MAAKRNPLEIYKLLNKSNCRKCMLPSCMAFAVAVIQGQKKISDCPEVDTETVELLCGLNATCKNKESEQQLKLNSLKQEVAKVDFNSVAGELGVKENHGQLIINCLGKDFVIDSSGEMSSECHYNHWVHMPLLSYIVHGQGNSPGEGDWLPFNQLKGAASWSRFFTHRCEKDMRQLVDTHTELFFELLHLFGAQPVAGISANHSLIIHPLPKLPMVINYWTAEENFPSQLNILFDGTAPDNLDIEYIYTITRGLLEMFRALIVRHNSDGKLF